MKPEALAVPGGSHTSDRRELAGVLGLAGLAGLLILFAASRSWLSVTVGRRPPFGPVRAELTGRTEFPALSGLAVVGLLIAVLVLVTGGWVRRLLGLLLALVGASAGWYGGRGLSDPGSARLRELLGNRLSQGSGLNELHRHPVWAGLTLAAAAVLVVTGVLVAVRAGHWKVGFSARYATPAAVAESHDPWRRLDRGEDPTISDR
jgi:uncharacterized membrane protein